MKDPFPDISDEQIQERYPHVASQLTAAHAYVKRYRQVGHDARMTEAELCGIAEAWTFLDSAEHGLFDNRDAWSLYNAQFILDNVRQERPAGGLDMLLSKSSAAIRALQDGGEPNPEDLANAESLLHDIVKQITGKPPVYNG
jgi:hypothetical protein